MPDLTPAPMASCTSLIGQHTVQGTSGTYTVTFSERWEAHCTCKAFQYGGGDWCKHINQVRDGGCHWNQLIDGGEPDGDHCPNCGAPLTYFTAMV